MVAGGWWVVRDRVATSADDTLLSLSTIQGWTDLPVHPDAVVQGSYAGSDQPDWAAWRVTGDVEQVREWYVAALPRAGWELTDDVATLTAQKDQQVVTMTMIVQPGGTVLIQASKP